MKCHFKLTVNFAMVSLSVGLTAIADSCLWVATVCLAVALAGFTVGEVEEARSALVTLQANHIVFAFALTISTIANV